jgi:hypothetical protein
MTIPAPFVPTPTAGLDKNGIAPFVPGATPSTADTRYYGVHDNTLIPDTHGGVIPPRYGPIPLPATATLSSVETPRIESFPAEVVAQIQAMMRVAGLIPRTTIVTNHGADKATQAGWVQLLSMSNRLGSQWQNTLTDLTTDPLTGKQRTVPATGSTRTGHTYTSTSTTDPTFTDPATAKQTVRDAMQQRLGRDPTDAEFARFTKALHSNDAQSGSTTTTSSTTDASGNTVSNSRTTGGSQDSASPSVVADQFARTGKVGVEGNTKMAAIDYYQAAMSKLGAGGGVQ